MPLEAKDVYDSIMQASYEANGIDGKWMSWEVYSAQAADKELYARAAEIINEKVRVV